jgi:hypothetical protein
VAEDEGKRRNQLPSPPALPQGLAEFLPIIEPRLSDIPEAADLPDLQRDLFQSDRAEEQIDDEVIRQAISNALENDRVVSLLGNGRFRLIGVSQLADAKGRDGQKLLVVIYSYHNDHAIEVETDLNRDGPIVAAVRRADYQPAPTEEEIEEAVEIARANERVEKWASQDLEPSAILTSAVDEGDPFHGRRLFIIGFGRPDERSPRIRAVVDISRERLISVSAEPTIAESTDE